ncbi:unnamed protein product [Caenorhabditis auriculariae]|uniref:Receptor L-domain domain-containing protein n=1 Tax=Caenorhabditis auriculariae TaxID=2777116 RepID=A0A8S1H3Q8_9PELO|nr:unnamed protein product [Caenorhabditis auriculariae]
MAQLVSWLLPLTIVFVEILANFGNETLVPNTNTTLQTLAQNTTSYPVADLTLNTTKVPIASTNLTSAITTPLPKGKTSTTRAPRPYIRFVGPRKCVIIGPLRNLSDILKCDVINDLLIDNNTVIDQIDPDYRLREINGCLKITNSDNLKNIDFLIQTRCNQRLKQCQHEIRKNSNLCSSSSIKSKIQSEFRNIKIDIETGSCEQICPGGLVDEQYFRDYLQRGDCRIITGTLKIVGWTAVPTWWSAVAAIEEIHGRLIIKEIGHINSLTFDNLRKIHNRMQRPAIEIAKNSFLKNLRFPKLELVDSPYSRVKVLVDENPRLKTDDLESDFHKAGVRPSEIDFRESGLHDILTYIIIVMFMILFCCMVGACWCIMFVCKWCIGKEEDQKNKYPTPTFASFEPHTAGTPTKIDVENK